jgi:hypothetical protein
LPAASATGAAQLGLYVRAQQFLVPLEGALRALFQVTRRNVSDLQVMAGVMYVTAGCRASAEISEMATW